MYHCVEWKNEIFTESCVWLLILNMIVLIFICVFFNWSIVYLQCCVSSGVHQNDSNIYFFPIFSSIVAYYRMLNIVRCATQQVGPCCLFCMWWLVSADPKLLIYPAPHCPPPLIAIVCFLCLWVCFCFVNKFIYIIF